MEIGLEKLTRFLLSILAAVGAILLDQPFGSVLLALIVLMAFDMVTALIANGKRGTISPNVGYLGWRRKATTVLLLLALKLMEALAATAVSLQIEIPAAAFVGAGFCMVELLSIMRNAVLCGVEMPEAIKKLFGDQL